MTTNPTANEGTTVLIVDDDPDIGQALADLLEHDGYVVRLAANAAEALEKIKKDRFSAIILDLGLPDMDGFDLLKALLAIDAKLPVIVLSAYTTQEKTIGALSQGAFAFLTKPYNREQLKATLSRAVGVKALVTRAEIVETALTASEDRFRSVVESANDGIVVANSKGEVISWNKAAQQLFGYAQDEIMGKPLTLLMPDRYRDAHHRGLERLQETGKSQLIGQRLQLSGLRKDATEFPIELSLATWTTRSDTYFCGIIRDVTERKGAEEALRIGEERFRTLVGNIPGVVYRCTCDPAWTMEYLSGGIQDLCGYPASDFTGNHVRSYAGMIHPDDRASIERIVLSAVEERRPYAMEYRVISADGSEKWVYEKGQAVFDGSHTVCWLDGVILDVTEQKRAEAALQDSEERLRLAMTAAHLGTWDWNISTGRVVWSESVESFFGVAQGSFGGTYDEFLERLHPEDRPRIAQAIARAVVESAAYNIEHRIIWPDGAIHWVACHGQVIRDANGKPVRMLGTIQSITDRKEADEALREQLRLATFSTELGIILTRSKILPELLSLCTDAIVHHLDASFARIWLLNPEGTVLALQASSGMYTHLDGPHSRVPIGQWKIGRIAASAQPHLTNDVPHDPQISDLDWAKREKMVAFAGYPLIVEERLVGVVALFARHRLPDFTINALASAANAIAGGIERKQSDEALSKLSHQLELILHSAGEGIYGLNGQGQASFVNDAAARMLGWDAHELIGRSMHSVHHHSRADGSPYPREECPIYAALRDGSVHSVYNEVLWRKDGSVFPVEYVSTPIREGGEVVGAVVVFKDITERIRAEEALRESEERFCQVTENIREVFWLSDLEKNALLYISPAYEDIWGRTCASLYLSPRSWIEAIHPDDRDRVLHAALTKQVGGEYNEQYRVMRPDGSIRWIHDRAFPVRNASGQVYRIAGIAEDITKRKQDSST